MEVADRNCVNCEEEIKPLTSIEEEQSLLNIPGWELHHETPHKISRRYSFKSYMEMIGFVNKIADAAEKKEHHPDLHLYYKALQVELSTHKVKGLSSKDFELAKNINELYGG